MNFVNEFHFIDECYPETEKRKQRLIQNFGEESGAMKVRWDPQLIFRDAT